jgi:hypothetical protein
MGTACHGPRAVASMTRRFRARTRRSVSRVYLDAVPSDRSSVPSRSVARPSNGRSIRSAKEPETWLIEIGTVTAWSVRGSSELHPYDHTARVALKFGYSGRPSNLVVVRRHMEKSSSNRIEEQRETRSSMITPGAP